MKLRAPTLLLFFLIVPGHAQSETADRRPAITRESREALKQFMERDHHDTAAVNRADREPVKYGDRYPAMRPDATMTGAGAAGGDLAKDFLKGAATLGGAIGGGALAIGGIGDGGKVTPTKPADKSAETAQEKQKQQAEQERKDQLAQQKKNNPDVKVDLSKEGKEKATEEARRKAQEAAKK